MPRPLKNSHIGFRLPAANKAALEENALKFAEAIGEAQGVEDLTPAKISRHLVDAFNKTMKSGELPVYPFKLVTTPRAKKTKKPSPLQKPADSKRSRKAAD